VPARARNETPASQPSFTTSVYAIALVAWPSRRRRAARTRTERPPLPERGPRQGEHPAPSGAGSVRSNKEAGCSPALAGTSSLPRLPQARHCRGGFHTELRSIGSQYSSLTCQDFSHFFRITLVWRQLGIKPAPTTSEQTALPGQAPVPAMPAAMNPTPATTLALPSPVIARAVRRSGGQRTEDRGRCFPSNS
jgi:hypothetical protein